MPLQRRAIYGVGPEAVTRNMRRHAKAINFGLIYGMSVFGLTRTTDLTLAEAETFVKAYFEKFPGIKKYLDGIRKQAAKQGYVETLLGTQALLPCLAKQSQCASKKPRRTRGHQCACAGHCGRHHENRDVEHSACAKSRWLESQDAPASAR